MERRIDYAEHQGVHIAYQVVGKGPVDLVYTPGIWSNLEIMWEWPAWARYLERLASFSRLILFDMRGVGLSDRGPEPPVLELQMDDVRAVMDAVGIERAAIFGGARGAAMTALFAASYPERASALVLYAPVVRRLRAPDWPYGLTEAEQEQFMKTFTSEIGRTGGTLDLQGGDEVDAAFRSWWPRFERLGASPSQWAEIAGILNRIDIRSVLPLIQAPTLVVHRTGDLINNVGQGRAAASMIPRARFVALPGTSHLPFLGDQESITNEIEEFLTGERHEVAADRVLKTVLFTDLVGSTTHAAAMGDRAWRDVLTQHHAIVRKELGLHRGIEIDAAGDGFMASFDGPARAVRCASSIASAVSRLGLQVRAGIHTGECELIGDKLAGIAVHIAARIAAMAEPGEVLVSGTVCDLVAGSGLRFADAGVHMLRGVPGEWRLSRLQAT